MQLSRFTDYALRVLIFVGRQNGRVCTMGEIAAHCRNSQEHLRKVLRTSSRRWAISIRGAADAAASCSAMIPQECGSATSSSRRKRI